MKFYMEHNDTNICKFSSIILSDKNNGAEIKNWLFSITKNKNETLHIYNRMQKINNGCGTIITKHHGNIFFKTINEKGE